MKLAVLCGSDLVPNHDRIVAGVDHDEAEIEEGVQVGAKQHPVRNVVRLLPSIREDVCCFQGL